MRGRLLQPPRGGAGRADRELKALGGVRLTPGPVLALALEPVQLVL